MKVAKQKRARVPAIVTLQGEVKNLLEMFEFFLTERHLGKPAPLLHEAVHDLRKIIGRLLTEHFLQLDPEREPHFCATLATLLAERAESLPFEESDYFYVDRCIADILSPFEWAQEIKSEFPTDPEMQQVLALGIPILEPFDYGLRERLRLVEKPTPLRSLQKHSE